MSGFLKFLLAIGLVILGGLMVLGAIMAALSSGIATSLNGGSSPSAVFWVIGIIGFIVFLGGVYMLRKN